MIKTLPYAIKHSGGPLVLIVLTLIAYFIEPLSGEWLSYDRYAIQGFETWRVLSGNIVHTNGYHVLLNIAGLVLLWALHGEHYDIGKFLKVFVWCALGTSAGLYLYSPDMILYAGLSGALHGLFVWGAMMDIYNQVKSGWLLLFGVGIKLFHEQWFGSSDSVAMLIDATVAVDAHLYGAFAGFIIFELMYVFSRSKEIKKTLK